MEKLTEASFSDLQQRLGGGGEITSFFNMFFY